MTDVRPFFHRPRRRPLSAAAVAALLLAALGLPPSGAVQPEYASLLALGRAAYDRRDYSAAIRNLRLACFGMLDEPKALADCLARLALAQDKANDPEGIQQTFQRLSEIEEKFSAYKQGEVPADLRAALEPRLQARIPAATLESSPGFRFLAPAKKPDAVAAKGTAAKEKGKGPSKPKADAGAPKPPGAPAKGGGEPAKPQSQGAASAKPLQETPTAGTGPAGVPAVPGANPPAPVPTTSPGTPPATAGTSSTASAPPPSAPTAATPAPPPAAAAPAARPLSDAERDVLQQAREKLAVEQSARDLRSIFDATRTVAEAHPESKEAQHLVGQSAYRLSRWSEAVTYFKRGGDPGDEQSELLFYVAVSLFESGDAAGAASTLRRALPNLRRTDYVDKYAKKILGQ